MKSILNYDLLQQVGLIYKKLNGTLFYAVLERGFALIMIGALLLPIIIFQPIAKVSAKTNNPPTNTFAPASEPPLPFVVSDASENSFIPAAVSRSFSDAFSPVTNFFTAPELPVGFAAAHTESPAYSYVSSIGSSVTDFFASLSSTVSPTASASNPPSNGTEFDYDGDGKADPAVWHQGSGNWKIKRSSDSAVSTVAFGATAAYAVPGDYDGDSISDLAIFHNGDWAIFQSSTSTVLNIPLGAAGDRPVSGDFNGDGMSDAAVYRPSTNGWIIRNSTNGTTTSTVWGLASDVLVPADYDGDGKTDIAVFRPSNGTWYINGSSYGSYDLPWGLSSDLPIPADFDGDGKADLTVFRPSTGSWYALKSSTSDGTYISVAWGNYNDQPVPADYDGDGKTDFAVFRPKTGMWHILKSSDWGYQGHTLGIGSDKLVEASYLKQNGSIAFDNAFARTRLSPRNATGGTNLYSQNFGWGSGLVGLSGRNGLDAGFGISYNSLVWIKHNNTMVFDPDYSNVAPGFRMGFSTIEPIYYDGTTEKYTYMMVSPSGARTEFRQTLVSNVYETADSSYLQLTANGAANPNDPAEAVTLTVRGTDGTQMNYEFKGGAYHPTQIKDRNGNYITIVHDSHGNLQTVTDTLGRVITVTYDSNNYPTSIIGQWNAGNGDGAAYTHVYATLQYATKIVNPSFAAGIGIYGPQGLQVGVLDKIIYGDSGLNTGETRFEYNDFGQVKKVRNYAKDGHELNYTATNLDTPGTNLTDVPRLTQTRSWAENYNGQGGIPAETVVTNSFLTGQQVTDIDGQTVSATLIQVGMANHPNGNVTNSYVGATGWMEGLPVVTHDYTFENSSYQLRRSSWTKWTQDDPNLSYIKNPRTISSKIGDDVSTRKTEIDYKMLGESEGSNATDNGLPTEVRLYDGATNTLLKKSTTQYNENAAYLSRRIIGLPVQSESYGLNQQTNQFEKISKTTYAYDEGNFNDPNLQQNISPIQHDNTNYGASFVVGRANLTSTTRHDVLSQSAAVSSSVKYNTAGNPVASLDPLGRQTKITYEDNFNDSGNSRNTFAYPTKLYDPAGKYSIVKYRFDTGANVWANSPNLQGDSNSNGKTTARIYDALGRLQRETLVNSISGAYTRYEYPTNGIQSKVWTTVIDANGSNSADAADEVYAESWSDGAGRTLRSRTEHPGSTGGWSGSIVEYDILGRVKRSTVPTEISVSGTTWTPAGDDARYDSSNNLVWLWTSAEYDWKSRVTREINTDGTDRLYSFEGCGCAGGQTTTVQSELVPRDDQPSVNARRKQKVYADVLGRTYKTEVMNWDGVTPYTTTVQTFNGRDQVVQTKQYAGAAVSTNTNQIVSMTYDGHGRMKTRHYPIEDTAANTNWSYNADDSIQMIVDPRGAITNFTYESQRGLLTNINYSVPTGSNIPVTPAVSFSYDALGNRTSIDTAGVSEISYQYDELSRMTSETVDFDDLTENYTVGYTYHLGGGLKSITDPLNSVINYTNDKTGRLNAVTGTAWGDNTTGNYASGITYRAFGKLKQINYTLPDETPQIKMDYDSRLRINHSEVVTNKITSGYLMKADFAYSADSRLQAKDDTLDNKFDRTNKYDHAGRLTFNQFGMGEASDFPGTYKRVYEQNIAYDTFSMMTTRSGVHWGNDIGFTESYTNGRIANNSYLLYDAAGNIIDNSVGSSNPHDFQRSSFDASGRRTVSHSSVKKRWGNLLNMVTETKNETVFDGDGHSVIEKTGRQSYHAVTGTPPPAGWQPTAGSYQIWSSVLGAGLMKVNLYPTFNYIETNVYAGAAVIAVKTRSVENNQTSDGISWKTSDPVTGTTGSFGGGYAVVEDETEPLGQKIDFNDSSEPPEPSPSQTFIGSADEPEWRCQVPLEYQPYHCQMKADIANSLNGTSIIVTYDPEKDKGDPNFMHVNDPPREQTRESADDSLRHEAMHAANKPKDVEYGGSTVQPASVPNETGETVVTERVYGTPSGKKGGARVGVRWKGGPSLDESFQGAEVGGDDPRVPTNEQLRDGLVNIRDKNDGKCGEFLDKVRSELGIKKNFEDLFDALIKEYDDSKGKEGGIAYVESLASTPIAIGDKPYPADGEYPYNGKDIYGKERTNAAALKTRPKFNDSVQVGGYVNDLIHELLHYAGKDHKQFAKAAFAASDKTEAVPKKKAKGLTKDETYSKYFQNLFTKYCR